MSGLIDKKIAELQDLSSVALRGRWEQALQCSAPKRINRELMIWSLAYHHQALAEGGLSKAAIKRLDHLANPQGNDDPSPRPPVQRLKPGTRLVREWRGKTHQVSVLEDGYDYHSTRYASLSRIAREITGTRWSGPLFFGLRKADVKMQRGANAG